MPRDPQRQITDHSSAKTSRSPGILCWHREENPEGAPLGLVVLDEVSQVATAVVRQMTHAL